MHPERLLRSAAADFNRDSTHRMRLLCVYPATFSHDVVSVRWQVIQSFHKPARPANHNLVRFRRLAQTEMQSQVALRNIAIAAANFFLALVRALLECDRCPQRGSI